MSGEEERKGRIRPGGGRRYFPMEGGYYWLPSPGENLPSWDVVTCHDLGHDADLGHVDLWPAVVGRLAAAWGREERPLQRRLKDRCYGLPRGRVTHPLGRWLILQGADAPRPDWLVQVCRRFDLDRRSVGVLYDEHETTFAEHRREVLDALGLSVGTSKEVP